MSEPSLFLFRDADQADVPALSALAADADVHAWSSALITSSLLAGHRVWIREMPDLGLVGFAVFQPVLDEAELLYLVINRMLQGQGLGKQFLYESLCQLKAQGCRRCFLEVRESNVLARRLYAGQGFELQGVRKAYYPAGLGREDALCLACDLTVKEI